MYFWEHLINGATRGSYYALIALGYTMVYGILRMINFAHGEVFMIGAYLGIGVLGFCAAAGAAAGAMAILAWGAAFGISMLACAALAWGIERSAYRPLRKADPLAPLISAIGVSILLQNAVRLIQGNAAKPFPRAFHHMLADARLTLWTSPSPVAGGEPETLSITLLQAGIVGVSVLLMAGLHLFITRTRLGTAMRAVSQDPLMARLVGIPVDKVIGATFAVGAVLAAAGGIMYSCYIGQALFTDGYLAGLRAFTAAVVGGIGNVPGAMLGGLLIGGVEEFAGWKIGNDWRDVFVFGLLIAVLIFRPRGLLGERVSEKV